MNRTSYALLALVLVLMVLWAALATVAFGSLGAVAENERIGPQTIVRPVRRVYP